MIDFMLIDVYDVACVYIRTLLANCAVLFYIYKLNDMLKVFISFT